MINRIKIEDDFPYTIDFSKIKSFSNGSFIYKVIHDGTDRIGSCNVEVIPIREGNDLFEHKRSIKEIIKSKLLKIFGNIIEQVLK